jgi:hypothetical protein
VNIADTHTGTPVGLVSYVRGYGLHADVWGDELGFVNLGIRSGTKYFHNILFAGIQAGTDRRYTAGWGLGGQVNITPAFFTEIEGTAQFIQEEGDWTDKTSVLNKVRLGAGWQINRSMALYGGPTLNYWVTETDYDVDSWASAEKKSGNFTHRLWPGFVAGVRF